MTERKQETWKADETGPWPGSTVRDARGETVCQVIGAAFAGDVVADRIRIARLLAVGPDGLTLAERLVRFFGDVPPDEIPVMVAEDPSTVTQFVEEARRLIRKASVEPRAAPSDSAPATPGLPSSPEDTQKNTLMAGDTPATPNRGDA